MGIIDKEFGKIIRAWILTKVKDEVSNGVYPCWDSHGERSGGLESMIVDRCNELWSSFKDSFEEVEYVFKEDEEGSHG